MTGIILSFYCVGIGVAEAIGQHLKLRRITFRDGPAPVLWPVVFLAVLGWKVTNYIIASWEEE